MVVRLNRPCPNCKLQTCNCPKRRPDYRPTPHQRGYTKDWDQLSQFYRKQNPLCVECEKEMVLYNKCSGNLGAEEVDHIIPWQSGLTPQEKEKLKWDWKNLQSLCHLHHTRKTNRETNEGK